MSRLNQALTEREARVLTFVRAYYARERLPPTLREIGRGCHLAHSLVSRYLDGLEMKGYLVRKPGTARGIFLLDESDEKL